MMILSNNIPCLDLHGMDREYSVYLINDFIYDHYRMKTGVVGIIHGRGSGILKSACHDTLKKNKYVEEYKIDNFNDGVTVVRIKKNC